MIQGSSEDEGGAVSRGVVGLPDRMRTVRYGLRGIVCLQSSVDECNKKCVQVSGLE